MADVSLTTAVVMLLTLFPAAGWGTGVCRVGVDDGDLVIECDDLANDVVVDQSALQGGEFRIGSGNSTLFDVGAGPVGGSVLVAGVTDDV